MAAATTSSALSPRTRGDYDEAARQYQRSLDISERLGDQAGMASSYGQLGTLAQERGDYDEAARQYQRSLDIIRAARQPGRHGHQLQPARHPGKRPRRPGYRSRHMACKSTRDQAPPRHPPGWKDLRRLAEYRLELGAGLFTSVLTQAAENTDLAEAITSLLDQIDKARERHPQQEPTPARYL